MLQIRHGDLNYKILTPIQVLFKRVSKILSSYSKIFAFTKRKYFNLSTFEPFGHRFNNKITEIP